MATTFDPATFLNQSFDEALDTKVIPCPAGEYLALAEKVDVKPWAAKDGSSSGLKLEVLWDVQDDAAKELTGRDTLRVPQQQMLVLGRAPRARCRRARACRPHAARPRHRPRHDSRGRRAFAR